MKNKIIVLSVLLFSFLLSQVSFAEPIRTIVNLPKKAVKGLVVIAPAKKYLMEERLFERLNDRLVKDGYIVVRFNWDANTFANPATELVRAEEILQQVVQRAQQRFSMVPRRTAIIAKSFSTKALSPTLPYAWHYTLLTPNCSVQAPFVHEYGRFLQRTPVPSTIVISNDDPFCDVRQIYAAMATAPRPLSLMTTYGDHNFVVPKLEPLKPVFAFNPMTLQEGSGKDQPKKEQPKKEEPKKEEPKKDEPPQDLLKDKADYKFQDMVVDFVAAQINLAI